MLTIGIAVTRARGARDPLANELDLLQRSVMPFHSLWQEETADPSPLAVQNGRSERILNQGLMFGLARRVGVRRESWPPARFVTFTLGDRGIEMAQMNWYGCKLMA